MPLWWRPVRALDPLFFSTFFYSQAVLEGDLEKAEFLCRFGGDLFALDPRFRNPLQVLYILKTKITQ